MERRVEGLVDVMRVAPTGDPASAVVNVRRPSEIREVHCDVLVIGGGTGGTAAAWAAARTGCHVRLVEETDWIGGQLTAQGVSALDEHDYIEVFGGTRTYYKLRQTIRDHYRNFGIEDTFRQAHPNPGNCWVTRLSFEPKVALNALETILAQEIEAGHLEIFLRTKVAAVDVQNDRLVSVLTVSFEDESATKFWPEIVVDATEFGDLLPLAGAEYVVGAEAKEETGEPHGQPGESKVRCVQSFTYTFGLERCPVGETRLIPKPDKYDQYRDSQPYSFRIHVHGGEIYSEHSGWLDYQMFQQAPGTKGSLWCYRRLIAQDQFLRGFPNDISMFNWPGMDYRDLSIVDRSPAEVARALQDAKRACIALSSTFLPVSYLRSSTSAWIVNPRFVRVLVMRLTTAIRLVSGRARQFSVMWQNMRCSILFHLLVPGGKCLTCRIIGQGAEGTLELGTSGSRRWTDHDPGEFAKVLERLLDSRMPSKERAI